MLSAVKLEWGREKHQKRHDMILKVPFELIVVAFWYSILARLVCIFIIKAERPVMHLSTCRYWSVRNIFLGGERVQRGEEFRLP